MLNERLYDYAFQSASINSIRYSARSPHDLMSPFSFRRLAVLVVLAPHIFSTSVSASPLQLQPRSSLQTRDSGSTDSLPPKIWAPILVVVLALFAAAIVTWWKGKGFHFFSHGAAAAGAVTGQAGTRELTAEQLAGAINSNTAATAANAATARTRRARRPRRTPSQISTTSLPAYNKEPGEEELVIFRGPQDMEDATMPAAVVMNPVDEDEEASLHTGDHSQVSRYTPMSTSNNNMPLLDPDDPSGDLSMQSLSPPPGEDMPRRSHDNNSTSSHEMSSLMRMDSNFSAQEPDPRGEAPAYFEVVDQSVDHRSPWHSAEPNSADSETTALRTASSPPSSPEQGRQRQRRSGFRSLLNRMSVVGSSQPSSHVRTDSEQSTTPSHGREASGSRASHRPSQSGSGSLLTSSMFRTLSRQKSTNTLSSNRLNSPSLISLNSISSPLTHTVIRTEFTYPKSGPTPEQLKLISSRESFARFGMPYGADAIAFAASASRQDLEPPPPDFDAAGSETHLPRSAALGPSRLRSPSNAADLQGAGNGSDSSDSGEEDNGRTSRRSSLTADPAVTTPLPESPPSSPSPPSVVPSTGSTNMTELRSSVLSLPLTSSSKLFAPSAYQTPSGSSRSDSRASSYSVQSFATAAETMEPSTPLAVASLGGVSDISEPTTPTLGTPRIGAQHVLEPTDATITPGPAIGMAV